MCTKRYCHPGIVSQPSYKFSNYSLPANAARCSITYNVVRTNKLVFALRNRWTELSATIPLITKRRKVKSKSLIKFLQNQRVTLWIGTTFIACSLTRYRSRERFLFLFRIERLITLNQHFSQSPIHLFTCSSKCDIFIKIQNCKSNWRNRKKILFYDLSDRKFLLCV